MGDRESRRYRREGLNLLGSTLREVKLLIKEVPVRPENNDGIKLAKRAENNLTKLIDLRSQKCDKFVKRQFDRLFKATEKVMEDLDKFFFIFDNEKLCVKK